MDHANRRAGFPIPGRGKATTEYAALSPLFSPPVTSPGGKRCRVGGLDNAADNSSAGCQFNSEQGSSSGTAALALRPSFGTLKESAWTPSAWTETDNRRVSKYLPVRRFLAASTGFVTVQS
jgi:hypothetical protein